MRTLPKLFLAILFLVPVATTTVGCGRSGNEAYVPSSEVPPEMTAEEEAEYEKQQQEMGQY